MQQTRPAIAMTATALDDYDPTCSCCSLVVSEVSFQLEHGEAWRERLAGRSLPTRVEIALDEATGIVVRVKNTGGFEDVGFEVEIVSAQLA
ncbi:hypothetical protein [Nocardioides perillae]|uniref:Putative Fe-S cluster-containing protein n=1 Tax=Nocardioides perillae TaxID=1119534 RepID=A0A7Y9USK4_9ACTN|nr:hypothetical protein [Nocardioides perillae]NYG55949.1 putative Fe-S cluster-containing protein [Nocardioides perillae]